MPFKALLPYVSVPLEVIDDAGVPAPTVNERPVMPLSVRVPLLTDSPTVTLPLAASTSAMETTFPPLNTKVVSSRSEERRVGKECRSWLTPEKVIKTVQMQASSEHALA